MFKNITKILCNRHTHFMGQCLRDSNVIKFLQMRAMPDIKFAKGCIMFDSYEDQSSHYNQTLTLILYGQKLKQGLCVM